MKTAVLISIVAASRQARDTQLLFDKMMDNNNVKEKTFFSETDSVLLELQFYLQSSGLVQDWILMIISVQTQHLRLRNFEPQKAKVPQ